MFSYLFVLKRRSALSELNAAMCILVKDVKSNINIFSSCFSQKLGLSLKLFFLCICVLLVCNDKSFGSLLLSAPLDVFITFLFPCFNHLLPCSFARFSFRCFCYFLERKFMFFPDLTPHRLMILHHILLSVVKN
jgi:hypothetical protein